jgi:MFS superfamily sulfate permease-like transporter
LSLKTWLCRIAGIPLQNGLYAAAAGAILYPIFGTSRQISIGPSSGLAAVAASAVLAVGITDSRTSHLSLPNHAGIGCLVSASCRVADGMDRAVLVAGGRYRFLFGAAIDVVIGELPKLTGTDVTGSNPLAELWSWLGTLGDVNGLTVIVGVIALVVVFGLRRVAPRVPGALVLVVGGLVCAWLFDLGSHGVALVGDVPRGLPTFELPKGQLLWDHAGTVAIAALALVLIGFLTNGR